MGSDRSTSAQIEYLQSLSEETGVAVPDEAFESKRRASEWIEKLQGEIEPTLRLTEIYDAEPGCVDVHRSRLYYNEPVSDDEHSYLKELGWKHVSGNKDHPLGYQYQRQDLDLVEEKWTLLRERFGTEGTLEQYRFEVGTAP